VLVTEKLNKHVRIGACVAQVGRNDTHVVLGGQFYKGKKCFSNQYVLFILAFDKKGKIG
jgi:hypothetical protein